MSGACGRPGNLLEPRVAKKPYFSVYAGCNTRLSMYYGLFHHAHQGIDPARMADSGGGASRLGLEPDADSGSRTAGAYLS